jgi:alpha-beta hydrolase superfamily lysophospholipase
MPDNKGVWSRRAILRTGGASLGAGLIAAGAMTESPAPARGEDKPALWSAEYWAKKGGVSLAMYRKRLGTPHAGEPPRPVVFLVHGSSVSAKPSFDLTVPGAGEYSLMNVLAGYGYDVWTMDHEGYGKSTRTSGNSNIASGVEDLKAGTDVVVKETGQTRIHFYGGSSGALRAGAFAMARPERCGRLMMEALTYKGTGSPTLTKRAEQVEFYRTHNRRPRDRNMIRSIFTRDLPGTSDPRVAEAMADAELVYGDTIPTGTYLDMTANLPVLDPAKIHSPVQILRGEHDGIATEEDLQEFFRKLPNPDRQFIVLAGASHAVTLGNSRQQIWHAVQSFLTMPGGA